MSLFSTERFNRGLALTSMECLWPMTLSLDCPGDGTRRQTIPRPTNVFAGGWSNSGKRDRASGRGFIGLRGGSQSLSRTVAVAVDGPGHDRNRTGPPPPELGVESTPNGPLLLLAEDNEIGASLLANYLRQVGGYRSKPISLASFAASLKRCRAGLPELTLQQLGPWRTRVVAAFQ